MSEVKQNILNIIKENAELCTKCDLCKTRDKLVFGEGNVGAKIMFVAEGPGRNEDETGRPFVGKAGKLLTNMIKAMGLEREEVYICNVVKCRPPGNRKPTPDEMDSCKRYLEMQIEVIKPKIIVTLGATAMEALLGPGEGITKRRGKWTHIKGYPEISVMPTFHPSFLLRNPAAKKEVHADLTEVKKMLNIYNKSVLNV